MKKRKKKSSSVNIKISNVDKLGKIAEKGKWCKPAPSKCGGCSYFLGFIGAVIYYISTATSFWMGVLGILKALVWPAFLIFEALKFLGA